MARDFDTNQSLKNAGILYVFQVFQTEELGQKIRQQPQTIYSAVTQVVDKFKADKFTKIYGSAAKKPQYFVVFLFDGKKKSFRVSEFSYGGYKLNERGTLKYKGDRIIDFRLH